MPVGQFVPVDGESVLGLTLSDVVDRMRGPIGSENVMRDAYRRAMSNVGKAAMIGPSPRGR